MPEIQVVGYTFTRVNAKGATENCYVPFQEMRFVWNNDLSKVTLYIQVGSFEDVEKKEAGFQGEMFIAAVKGNEFFALALQPVFAQEYRENILDQYKNNEITKEEASAAFSLSQFDSLGQSIWTALFITPFVPDYAEYTQDQQNGILIPVKKSLQALNAEIQTFNIEI